MSTITDMKNKVFRHIVCMLSVHVVRLAGCGMRTSPRFRE